jgi:hypothetical protein
VQKLRAFREISYSKNTNCTYTLSAGYVSLCTNRGSTGPVYALHLSDELNWPYKGLTYKIIKV